MTDIAIALTNGRYQPSQAALSLDTNDLPIGTVVSYRTDQGFSGSRYFTGVVTARTAKNYVIRGWLGQGSARIPLDAKERMARRLTVVATAQENEQALTVQRIEGEKARRQREEARAQAQAQAEEQARQRRAHQAAVADLIEAHKGEFEALMAKYLEA